MTKIFTKSKIADSGGGSISKHFHMNLGEVRLQPRLQQSATVRVKGLNR